MYHNYTYNLDGEVIVNDAKKMTIKDNHLQIEKELKLENDIEVLNSNVEDLKEDLQNLGPTHKENDKRKRKRNILAILMGILLILGCKVLPVALSLDAPVSSSPLFWIHSKSDALLTALMMTYLPMSISIFIATKRNHTTIKNYINETEILLSELDRELSEKEQELQEVRKNKFSKSEPDKIIHDLYPTEVKERVHSELESKRAIIRKYQKLRKYVQQNMLEEKLIEENLQPKEQEFVHRLVKK